MLFDARGIAITLAVLAAVTVLCAVDLSCSGRADSAGVMSRVKGEVAAGKNEFAILRRDQLAEQLRSLRALHRKLVRDGNAVESRRVMALILDVQKQHDEVDCRLNAH